jgi:hypothetical protein
MKMTKKATERLPMNPPCESRRHTHLMVDVTFDSQRTDSESLASGINRLWQTGWELAGADFQEDYGPFQVGEFLDLADPTEPTRPPPVTFAIHGGDEDAHPPIPVEVNVDEHGVVLTPRNVHGQPLGDLILDINEERIEVLVFEPDDPDHPTVAHVLLSDLPRTFQERRPDDEEPPPP